MRWKADLVGDIRTHSEFDDLDGDLSYLNTVSYLKQMHGTGWPREFTECNKSFLMPRFLSIKDSCKGILEIGVCRNEELSSTHAFIQNKRDDCFFIGIDLEDKKFLDDEKKRVYTIQNSSSDVDKNIATMKSLGVSELGFIFIDGWHSINQVLIDWEYTQLLSENGIVAFHDVNHHPGPNRFVDALNPLIWDVTKHCPNDWGIAFAKRRVA